MALTITINSVDLTAYLVSDSLSIEGRANAFVSTCSLKLIDKDADVALAFEVKEKDVIVISDGATKHFEGTLANIGTVVVADGTEALVYTLDCQDYNLLLEEVVIDQVETYGAVYDSVIIDDLFDKYLPEINSHGPGDAPPGYVESLHIFAELELFDMTLREALDRVATGAGSTALTGYWYVDFEKNLHYYNEEDNAPTFYLSDVPDNVTSFPYLAEVTRERQGATIVNRILVIGAEFGLFVQDYDSYNYYGKWFEGIVRDNTLFSVDEVLAHGYGLLAKLAYPDEVFHLATRKAGLQAGMNVRFENALFGTGTKTNLILNPSFEVNVTDGWTFAQDGAGGSAAQSAVRAAAGTQSCLITASNAGNATLSSDNIALANGETIAIQARIYRATAVTCSIEIYDATTAATRATLAAALTAGWETLTTSWTNTTGGAVNVQLILLNEEGDGASQIWCDACMAQIDKGPYSVVYVDGTMPYCSWSGAAHNSSSSRLPVFTITELTLTFPENTPTYALTLGGKAAATSLISSRNQSDYIQAGLGLVVPGQLPVSSKGWTHDLAWTATNLNTVTWAAGTITTADAVTYSIVPGTTGVMAAITYIYLDVDTSLTVLQTSTSVAVGRNILLVGWAAPSAGGATTLASYQIFGGEGQGVLVDTNNIADDAITATQILANTITANEIAANTITAGNIAAGAIETDELYAGAVTAVKIAANTITANKLEMGMGDAFYNRADGLLLLSPYCEILPTKWTSLRRQAATISGAFSQASGRWQGTRALRTLTAGSNLVTNPSFEIDTTNWTFGMNAQGAGYGRITTEGFSGTCCAKAVCSGGGGRQVTIPITRGVNDNLTVTAWVRSLTGISQLFLDLVDRPYDSGYVAGATVQVGADWTRITLTVADAVLDLWTNSPDITLRVNNEADDGTAKTWLVDAVQVEPTLYTTPYFDGSLGSGFAWTSTVHASTSTRTASDISLDDLAGLISNNDTLSFRVVVQMSYAHDGTWPQVNNWAWLAYTDASNYMGVKYYPTDDKFYIVVRLGGTTVEASSSAQSFEIGEWFDLIATIDLAGNVELYLNGILVATEDVSALTATTFTSWSIGHFAASHSNYAVCEYAVFDRVLTAIEAADLYAMSKPLIDTGASDTPGIYILDGRFRIASSSSGNRIDLTGDEIAGYDSLGVKQFYLEAATGVASAGGGAVTLDEDGLNIKIGDAEENKIAFDDSGTERGHIWEKTYGSGIAIYIKAGPPGAGDASYLSLAAYDENDAAANSAEVGIHATVGATPGYIQFSVDNSNPFSVYADGARVATSAKLVFYGFSGADHYLYKSGNDIYWYNGTVGQKLN